MTMTKKDAYTSNELQLQNHSLTFIHKKIPSFSYQHSISFTHGFEHYCLLGQANLVRFCAVWQMAKHIWTYFTVQKGCLYLDVKLEIFKKNDNKEFRLVESLTMGEAEFKQFMRLRSPQVIVAKNFAREVKLSPVGIPTMSKYMDERLKLAHKLVDVVDRAKTKVCVTLLRYNVDGD